VDSETKQIVSFRNAVRRETMNQTNSIKIIETGLARCVTEPCGAKGLEGYGLGQSYRFERCEDGKGRYCRVYPDQDFPDYYETCGEVVFAGYFEPVEVQGVAKERE
jgi:hypothetical protein